MKPRHRTYINTNTQTFIQSATIPTTLFVSNQNRIYIRNVDLSNFNGTLFGVNMEGTQRYLYACKLHASVTVAASVDFQGAIVSIVNCDSGATNTRNELWEFQGKLTTETTIVRTSGASNGTPYSWKIVTTGTSGHINKLGNAFECFSIPFFNTTLTSQTVTIEMISDGVTFNNDEVFMILDYLGSASFPLGSQVNNSNLDNVITTPTAITTSTATWTTTGLSSPVKQKLQTTFTASMTGLVIIHIYIAKISSTLYIDPIPN